MRGLKIDINTLLIIGALVFVVLDYFQDPEPVSTYTEDDRKLAQESAKREIAFAAMKQLVELDEQIIKEDEKIIDSTVNFVATHYRSKRDSLFAVAFGK